MKAIICFGLLAMLAGCDGSKAELESTKTNLMNVTKERDELKTQVSTLEQQLTIARSDLEKQKATEAPGMAGKAGNADAKAAMAAKSGASATPTPTPSKKKGAHKS